MAEKKILIFGSQVLGPYEKYLVKGFQELGYEVAFYNSYDFHKNTQKIITWTSNIRINRLDEIKNNYLLKKVNKEIIKVFCDFKPDIVISYNDSLLIPRTIKYFQENNAKYYVFMCDDTMWISSRWWYTLNVTIADKVFSHDEEWLKWIRMMGNDNCFFISGGSNPDVFYPTEPTAEDIKEYGCDVLFVGTCYGLNADGIYRASILNSLTDYKLKIYGDSSWNKLFKIFPDLEKHYTNRSLTLKELNTAMHCCKIYLALSNSGVPTGVYTRVYDSAMSGAFFLAEYRTSFDKLFPEGTIQYFKNIYDLNDKVKYFLNNPVERNNIGKNIMKIALNKFSMKNVAESIISSKSK